MRECPIPIEEGIPDIMIWEADLDLKFLYVSPSAEKLFGYPTSDWIGKRDFWESLIVPADKKWVLGYCSEQTLKRQAHECTYRMKCKNGQEIWVRDKAYVKYDEQGRATGLRGFMLDVTEQKRVEDRLREIERRYRIANRVTRAVAWEWDLQTNSLNWGENLSGVFLHSLEISRMDIYFWFDNIHPDDREKVVRSIYDAIQHKREWSEQYRFRTGADGYCWVEDAGWVIADEYGTPVRMIGAMRDITSRVEAENERDRLMREDHKARVRLERVLQARDELVDVISHDIKNPLSSILMNISLAMRLIPTPAALKNQPLELDRRLTQIFGRIHQSAERMKSMIQDAVDMSKSISGVLYLDTIPRDMSAIVRDALIDVETLRAEKKIKVDNRIEKSGLNVLADVEKINRALQKILAFILKVVPEESEVSIIGQASDGEVRVQFCFERGTLSDHRVPEIFERKGKDLDMPIAKGIIHALGGRAWSELIGNGASVQICILLRNARGPVAQLGRLSA